MKTKIILSVIITITLAVIYSCESKDNQKPTISNLEVGHNDTIFAGYPVHLEFEVTDNDLLSNYHVIIHSEEGHHHKSISITNIPWEFDSIFREISGLKNYTVHHHTIHAPSNAETGNYHFHLTVADQAGNSVSVEKDITMAPGEAFEGDEH
ncbi:MAG: DUF4625 domain-containing protein [Bacteroidales bacterium]